MRKCRICGNKYDGACSNEAMFRDICKKCLGEYHSSLLLGMTNALKKEIEKIKLDRELTNDL